VDHFTRYVYIRTSANQTANEIIKLINSVHTNNPICTLLTDQYGSLNSNEFNDYVIREGINHIFTAIDNPSSNGLNERLNQTLVNRIRCKINEKKKKVAWASVARECVSEYNDTIHSSTLFAPNYLMNGVLTDMVPRKFLEIPDLLDDRKRAFENSMRSHETNKIRYDKKKDKTVSFEVGDYVFVENGNKLNRHKLDEIRIGPFLITNKLSNTVFELQTDSKSNARRFYHCSKMIKMTNDDESIQTA
jgi:hypothetical protein